MPWTAAQMRSIQARAHGWQGPGAFQSVSQGKAQQMATEGIKPESRRTRLADALSKMRSAGRT
jgi:hypothetical protein